MQGLPCLENCIPRPSHKLWPLTHFAARWLPCRMAQGGGSTSTSGSGSKGVREEYQTSLLLKLQAQNLTDATSSIDKIRQFSKIDKTNFWSNNAISMPCDIYNFIKFVNIFYFMTESTISNCFCFAALLGYFSQSTTWLGSKLISNYGVCWAVPGFAWFFK